MSNELTIYDLAKDLGVSPTTISRALNDHPAVNEKTKKRIFDRAGQLGYRFNVFASSLRSKRTNNVGVIVPRLNSNFQSSVLAGMEKVANAAGLNLVISQSLESYEKEMANVKTMFKSRVDGLLVSLSEKTVNYDHFKPLLDKKIPVLFFDRVALGFGCTGIVIDNTQAGYDATAHLLAQGCTRIAHVLGNPGVNVYADRLKGYRYALMDQGIPFDPELVLHSEFTEEASEAIVDWFLERHPRATGFFVSNDSAAASCIRILKKRGLRIPEDIAVVGFNNDIASRLIEPNLTTTNYPGFEMGEVAMRNLVNHLDGQSEGLLQKTNMITLRSELIIRESSLRHPE